MALLPLTLIRPYQNRKSPISSKAICRETDDKPVSFRITLMNGGIASDCGPNPIQFSSADASTPLRTPENNPSFTLGRSDCHHHHHQLLARLLSWCWKVGSDWACFYQWFYRYRGKWTLLAKFYIFVDIVRHYVQYTTIEKTRAVANIPSSSLPHYPSPCCSYCVSLCLFLIVRATCKLQVTCLVVTSWILRQTTTPPSSGPGIRAIWEPLARSARPAASARLEIWLSLLPSFAK